MPDEIKSTALVPVGSAQDDEAIYCEAVELKPGQNPEQRAKNAAFNAIHDDMLQAMAFGSHAAQPGATYSEMAMRQKQGLGGVFNAGMGDIFGNFGGSSLSGLFGRFF